MGMGVELEAVLVAVGMGVLLYTGRGITLECATLISAMVMTSEVIVLHFGTDVAAEIGTFIPNTDIASVVGTF